MNTSFPSFGPWDQGLISAFWNLNIYTNQRHLAAGFALGLGFITLLLFLQKKSWKQQLPFLLISVPLLSVLPYFHQPMLIIIGLFMIWYFFALKNIRIFLFLTGLISVGPVFVQLLTFSADPSSLVWYPGYLIHAAVTPVLFSTYWFHNLGLHVILIPIGFLLAPKTVKKALFPIFIVFLIANLFKFSVEVAANHKFFNFFMIFGNMLSAYVIILMWNLTCAGNVKNFILLHFLFRKKTTDASLSGTEVRKNFLCNLSARRKAVGFLSCCLIILLLTLSGIIDFFAVINDQKLSIVDIPRNEIATWIAINTPKDAIFLNSSYLYHPASLAGRSIFLGWPYFPWSAGYKENRMPIMNTMYESKNPEVFCPLFHKYNISYITVENVSGNPALPTISPLYFRSVAAPVFSSAIGTYAIFTTDSLCFSIAL